MLTHCTSETVYWSEAAGPLQSSPLPSNLTRGFNQSLCCEEEDCKEENGTGEGMAKAANGLGHCKIPSKVGPIIAVDQGSCQGHQWSET
jgi:hypothetical protein